MPKRIGQAISLEQKTTISLERIKEGALAEMNTQEVSQLVEKIIEENPSLEKNMNEEGASIEYSEPIGEKDAVETTARLDDKLPEMQSDGNDYDVPRYRVSNYSADSEHYIPEEADSVSLSDYLLSQIDEQELTENQRLVAQYIIGNLDSNGWLTRSAELIADDVYFQKSIDVAPTEVEGMILKVQQLDPPGICARNLQECVLLQLRQKKSNAVRDLAIEIVTHYWDRIRTPDRISEQLEQLGVGKESFERAWKMILKCNPKPGSSFSGSGDRISPPIIPEFKIDVHDEDIHIVVINKVPELEISESYRKTYDTSGRTNAGKRENKDFQRMRQNVEDGRKFIDMLKTRQENLYRTMESIVKYQHDYFLSCGDNRMIKPMTLRDVAQDIGKDESYVSRATSTKYADTPWGNIRLGSLFSEGVQSSDGKFFSQHAVKEHLLDLVEEEDKHNPLSDSQLSERLAEMGFPVSRRTVAKYREQLNIESSKERKIID